MNPPWDLQIYRDLPWEEIQSHEREMAQRVHSDHGYRVFLVSEPRPTYTRGLSAKREDLIWNESTLKSRGIAVHTAPRGGQWTYHGPGQIVIFPIAHLEGLGLKSREVRRFIDQVRDALIDRVRSWEIPAEAGDNPYGIYVDQKKLASFGFSFERGVVKHGVALYYSPQNEALGGIHPCGQRESVTTSLQELGVTLTWEEAAHECVNSLKSSFQAHLV